MDLGLLFRQYGSDKDRNGYTPLYQSLFKNIRDKPYNILEIGVGCSYLMGVGYIPGASLKAWADYFPQSRVFSVDVHSTAINLTMFDGRITTHYCDTTNKESVNKFIDIIKQLQGLEEIKFDIIIDDGSHLESDQIITLQHFMPYLNTNGYYIVEDIGGDLRNVGYNTCKKFHPPRQEIRDIIGNKNNYVVHDFTDKHQSAVLIISD